MELISGKVPDSLLNSLPKPVLKKRGKLSTFLRSLVKARPRRATEPEPTKEGVFGCDLGEHLLRSGRDVPQVLQSCAQFIEEHGVVRGIYRLSGVASRIQRLRHEFDTEQVPELSVRELHSVSSLCKLYFRELPNPLLTDQLYDKFSDAVCAATEEERVHRMQDAIQQLPAPHYRTLEYLMRHLASLAGNSSVTNMDAKNLAIVWAPNLLRSQQSQSACASGEAACMELQTQSAVVEFIISHTDVIFCSKSTPAVGEGHSSLAGLKSVWVSPPATKLLTVQEAQAERNGQSSSPTVTQSSEIEEEEAPAVVQGNFHTVIDFPSKRPSSPRKRMESSRCGSWCSCLCLQRPSPVAEHQLQYSAREPSEAEFVVLAGDSSPCVPRRLRACDDDTSCASINGVQLGCMSHCSSKDSLPRDSNDGEKNIIHVQALIHAIPAEAPDLSLPDTTGTSLNCDPVAFEDSPAQAQPECPDSSTTMQAQVSITEEKLSISQGGTESGHESQAPGNSTVSEQLS
ncbi:rho GTPase-activating protein 32-like [Coturnix japonica]|uniref:rho GTPase-activating protein 32-like n=1 Tax=Coturnix japonica TaxID=93934 RepID=UPI0007772886|nr:rho GTPase-activating protein 32-like [Coturnix japonica]